MINTIKCIECDEASKMLYQSIWLVEKTVRFGSLRICEGAVLTAPEGKQVTMLVNGIVREPKPGTYVGDIVLYVSEIYAARPEGLMVFNQIHAPMVPAVCVENGALSEEKSVSAAVSGGSVSAEATKDAYFGASASNFSGIIVDNSDYTVENIRMDLEGKGRNDFAGCDAGVAAFGKSNVTIRDSSFQLAGVTRCAIHVSGDSRVKVENCDILNICPDSGWTGRFCWVLPLEGSNRLCQLAGNGQVEYINCRMKTNGWGVLSIDGSDEYVCMTVKDSKLELSGPDSYGYGTFCIGPNDVIVDHSEMDVYGYPMMIMGMEGKAHASILNGSVIRGRRFGAMCVADDNTIFTVKDSTFDTQKASIVVKESASDIRLENSVMKSGEGVLLQLMDTDECGMDVIRFPLPIGVIDTPIEGRKLAEIDKELDVRLSLKDMSVTGDIYNSTTNIRAYLNAERNGMGEFHDTVVGPVGFNGDNNADSEAEVEGAPKDQRGPKNLLVRMENASVAGVISAATQAYREGLTELLPENRGDISNIKQTAAPVINNGVILEMDAASRWVVTGTSYLSKLVLAPGASVVSESGKAVRMTVDGIETPVAAGEYIGKITIEL